ncbi:3-hydroxyacyl-ACP dehydratase FabZ family protein [Desulfovibrio sp. JC022]|uniref:3-hydroxyacyl-ACP dehydratase FabZ family protein n=1 Tax=Desulfovibrio sp. JC022 TaxID=2593642 RepID=UPI0013D5D9C7|nr:3-hydroxyacyl-ACP dehydratase [Desulfovibrio sp. JC022]NDV23253.1 3-hydroxyacyl-ACP dehydratase [Desulfovibrio sp. JC022]
MDLNEHISKSSTVLEKSETGYTRSYVFKKSFPGFDGHFPGNPILPGVIQTLLGQLSAAEALEHEYPAEKITLQSVTRCKFLRPVKPMETLELSFSLKTKGLNHIAICSLTVDGETAATYQLIFAPEGM